MRRKSLPTGRKNEKEPPDGGSFSFLLLGFGGVLSFLGERGEFRAPARVTFGRSPKSDQKVCLKPKVSRLPARYALAIIGSFYRTVTGIFLCRADKRTVSASAPLPLISATVEAGAPMFQSKSGSEKRSRDDATFRRNLHGTAFAW